MNELEALTKRGYIVKACWLGGAFHVTLASPALTVSGWGDTLMAALEMARLRIAEE